MRYRTKGYKPLMHSSNSASYFTAWLTEQKEHDSTISCTPVYQLQFFILIVIINRKFIGGIVIIILFLQIDSSEREIKDLTNYVLSKH